MGARVRSRRQKIKQYPFIVAGIIVVIFALVAFTFAVYQFGWDWTGFSGGYSTITIARIMDGTTTAKEQPPTRTLWDWLQLLIIPIMLIIGGFWLNQIQKSREQRTTQQQAENEQKAVEHRARVEQVIARDDQREVVLQSYIDKMSELLLDKGLRKSQPEEEVRSIAHVRTLTVLTQLDSSRKKTVLQFLHESGLIDKVQPIIDLSEASLSEANLSGSNLSGANLTHVSLSEAVLYKADLSESNLSGANLHGADLSGSNLSGANLREAFLSGVNLSEAVQSRTDICEFFLDRAYEAERGGADLSRVLEADLSRADLSGTVLHGAFVTTEQLAEAKSLKGATMPDGTIHE